MKFRDLCLIISDQTEDTNAFFDKAREFLHIIWGESSVNEALSYFAGASSTPGVILYMKRYGSEFQPFVFAYRNDEWRDLTKDYLGPFHLAPNDYIVVPQYGRTARVLTFDPEKQTFHHKLWLHWTGLKFEAETAKPKDWRCPDSYSRYFTPEDRRQCCE